MPINTQMSEMTARQSRRFFFSADFLIPLLIFIVTLIVFRRTDLDLQIQSRYFAPGYGWFMKDWPLFRLLYHYGNIPALIIAIGGLILLGLSFQALKWAKWRKIGLFLVLAMLLGPGLVINTVLKDNWGRPRPRNTIEFGGLYNYEQLLSIDKSSPGKSFPCGHASMGFYLFVPWFLLRKRKKALALLSLSLGIASGAAIGLARVAQGGHYASDVIIAGLLVYWISGALFYLMRFNRALWYYPKQERIDRKQRAVVTFIVSVCLLFLILGVVLATPYSEKKPIGFAYNQLFTDTPLITDIDMAVGDISIVPADTVFFAWDTQGFGFPRSKLVTQRQELTSPDSIYIGFSQKKKGFFTELTNSITASCQLSRNSTLRLRLDNGNARISLPDSLHNVILDIMVRKGNLDLDLPDGFKPRITLKGDFTLADSTGFNSADNIYIREDFKVNLVVLNGQLILR